MLVVLDKLGIKDFDLNNLPSYYSYFRKDKRNYRDYYDDETKEIVTSLFKKEIDLFKYEF
jgi:hypothetical protein